MKRLLIVLFLLTTAFIMPLSAQDDPAYGPLIDYNGQQLFLSGMNLAWINFAHDLDNFNEVEFVAALDALATVNGNTLRWWLHTTGSASPLYGEDGKVTGPGEKDIETLARALDLAYERGILIMPTLWSHDMMNTTTGIPTAFNKLMIEDPEYTQAYIDNALTPMVTALAGHPGIIAWEIFNEPEGTTSDFNGWTGELTEMKYIQQFVNLLTGAIHRADPAAKVTNGSWNMQALTDVGGFTNYYTDERLIEAGGDPDGTLDFYQVHYYPEWFDETTSPFHNPYSYWELDKPLIVGEFPAKAIADLGMGFRPRRQLRNSMESYEYLLENGYAGALAWTFFDSPHGDLLDASPGILRVNNLATEHIKVDIGEVDRIPVVEKPIDNLVIANDQTEVADYVNLADIFNDTEDGDALTYTVSENTKPELVEVTVGDSGGLSFAFPTGETGTSVIAITATDSGGKFAKTDFVVNVYDPNQGNVALGKTAISSTIENASYLAEYAVDGLDNTRSSTTYEDAQWLDIDLGEVYTVSQVVLKWEAAYGGAYDIQVWDGANWQTVFSEVNGDGDIDDISLTEPVDTQYVRMNGIRRGTEWGYSLWEFEVFGLAAENPDETLTAVPPSFTDAAAAAGDSGGEASAPASESTALHSFESDEEGFVLADYWAGGSAALVSPEGANDGAQSLAIAVSYSGTAWEEAGVYLQPAGGVDWSAYDQLAIDVFVPEGADNFIAQIFIKTGDAWAWANTPDTALTPGQWTTITADLSAMGDSSAVYEYGVKVGTSTTAFEGNILVDNVRLVAVEEVETAPSETASEATTLNGFESDLEGFTLADYWAGGSGIAPSTANASEGAQSLAITVSYSGTAWEEAGVYLQPAGGVDWSAYNQLAIDVYVPEGATNFIAQIFIKTGDDWAWANTPDTALVPGQWTTITADLSAMGDPSAVYEYGVKVGTSATAYEGDILIDNVRLISLTEVSNGGGDAPTTTVPTFAVNSVTPLDGLDTVGLYEKFELIADISAEYTNPYDPNEIRVDGRFTSPSGVTVTIPGFYYRDYVYSGSGPVAPTQDWSWRLRFAPTELGEWRYQVLATTSGGTKRGDSGTFTVVESDNPGYVRVDPRNPHYFAFDNGQPYFPVGQNVGWSTSADPIGDYAMWYGQMNAVGANFSRVWMAPWGFGIEWTDTGLGNYDRRQANAYALDKMLELAEENDIYVMLSLINHGSFSETTNAEWDQNPFNAANGGPLASPAEFATHPDAIKYWHQRLRYIVARWGYSTHIMSWEWWNEINWTVLVNADLLAPWIERSAAYLKSLDPTGRLITHSGSLASDDRVWSIDSLDFTQDHRYDMDSLTQTFNNVVADWLGRYPEKPFLMGEFGLASAASETDADGVLLHLGLWSAPMNGAAGTAMTWWWDNYIHPLNLYYHFGGVAKFFAGEDLAAQTWQAGEAAFAERTDARAYGLRTSDSALLWAVNRDFNDGYLVTAYTRALRDALRERNKAGGSAADGPVEVVIEFPPVEGAVLVLPDMSDGVYAVEMWDTFTGEIIETLEVTTEAGTLSIALPTFTKDIALKVRPA